MRNEKQYQLPLKIVSYEVIMILFTWNSLFTSAMY